jgi:hypothetical protein
MQRLALMMALMVLGMPQVYSCHTSAGLEMSWGGDVTEPRICPLIMAERERGSSAAGEPDRPSVLHKMSSAEQGESAALRGLQQIQLEMEKLQEEREETQKERLELQKACQLMKEEMQSTHQLQIETQRACQLMREETRSTHQLQVEIHRLLSEVWKPGDDGPILTENSHHLKA